MTLSQPITESDTTPSQSITEPNMAPSQPIAEPNTAAFQPITEPNTVPLTPALLKEALLKEDLSEAVSDACPRVCSGAWTQAAPY